MQTDAAETQQAQKTSMGPNYKTWTLVQWRKVMFTDEKKFELFRNILRQYVQRRRGDWLCFANCEAWGRISAGLGLYHM